MRHKLFVHGMKCRQVGTITLLICSVTIVYAQSPLPNSPEIEQRVDQMLKKLSLEQKLELIGGDGFMYTKPMPVISLPQLKMSDDSVGVRTWGFSTAYAAGISLAASVGIRHLLKRSVLLLVTMREPAA